MQLKYDENRPFSAIELAELCSHRAVVVVVAVVEYTTKNRYNN